MTNDAPTVNQLWRENQRLQEENRTLRGSLEQLIAVNSELTQSIEEYMRIRELENENRALRNNLNDQLKNKHQEDIPQVQQMAQVIKQLMMSSNDAKITYQQEVATLTREIENQHNHWHKIIGDLKSKHAHKIQQYQQTISQLRHSNEAVSKQRVKEIQKTPEGRNNERVSTTIEDMRHVYEKELQDKDRTIRVYENVLQKLKEKLKEKY